MRQDIEEGKGRREERQKGKEEGKKDRREKRQKVGKNGRSYLLYCKLENLLRGMKCKLIEGKDALEKRGSFLEKNYATRQLAESAPLATISI